MPSAIATPADVDDIHTATRQANINRCMFSLSSDHRPRFSIDGPLGGDAVKVSKCLHDLPVDPRHRKPLPCSHPHIRARSAHRANIRRVSTTLENEAVGTLENEATQTDWLGDLSGGLGVGPPVGGGWGSAASGRAGSRD